MYALVEDNTITKIFNHPKGFTLGDIQYPQNIFSLWTKVEKEAIGIYEIEQDNTNKKNEDWYINTGVSYAFGSGKVTASYGTATARAITDSTYTNQDNTDGLIPEGKSVGDVKTKGLKTVKKEIFDRQAAGLLAKYDWYIIRNTEASTAIPSAITDYRTAVRAKCNSMQTQIDNASDVDALAALYAYVNTGTEENPVMEKPLGEWPTDPNAE
jgi:hypothetical protein